MAGTMMTVNCSEVNDLWDVHFDIDYSSAVSFYPSWRYATQPFLTQVLVLLAESELFL